MRISHRHAEIINSLELSTFPIPLSPIGRFEALGERGTFRARVLFRIR